jgi:hypothetical protein
VHVPLLLLDDQVSALSVLIGIAGLLILGVVVRLLMGVMMRAALDSVLAVGIMHQVFDASNNNGALVDSLLDGADAGNMTQLAAVVLTVLIAAWLLWRRPCAFAKRHIPLPDSTPEAGDHTDAVSAEDAARRTLAGWRGSTDGAGWHTSWLAR